MKRMFSRFLSLVLAVSFFGCVPTPSTEGNDEAEMDGMQQAIIRQFIMTRDLGLNQVPTERLLSARDQQRSMIAARGQRTLALSWQERGPNNIGGRSRAILVDQADATGNTVFAASVSGGIFKTTNFNSSSPTWVPVNDQLENLAVTALAQNRTNPSIMYAGTGEGFFNVDAVRGAGIFKSTNGGATWTRLAATATFEYIQDVVVDNNQNVYASLRNASTLNRGVVRSTDGGATWTQVLGLPLDGFLTGRASDLEVASNGDVYATLGIFSPTMVMRSSFATHGANTGNVDTWVNITPQHSAVTQRGELSVSKSNPLRLYLMMVDSANSQVNTIYRSSNAGVTWDSLPAPSAINNGANSQNWYNLCSEVDPNNPNVVVVGGFHVARSLDGGANWTNISAPSQVHVDQHVLLFTSSSRLLVGNDGGIYSSDNMTAGTPTFQKKNNGFNVTQFYGADMHPTVTNFFLAGAQDNNTQLFAAPGINTTFPVVGGDGGFPHIDQTDGQLQIAATTANNFYRSLDGGNNFSYMSAVSNNRGQFINPTDLDDETNSLYSSDDPGRYYCIRNLDGSPNGTVNTLAQMGTREVTAIKVDPTAPNTVWLGASLGGNPAMLLKVSSANTTTPTVVTTFTFPTSGSNAIPANAYLSSIDVDASNGNHIVATFSNFGVKSIYESTNGGTSFTSIEGNLPDMPVYWAMIAPPNALLNGATGGTGGILIGTDLGVWSTTTTAGTSTQWIPNDDNFPNVRTDMIKYRPSDRTVLAATHGRGLYTTTLPTGIVGIPSVTLTKDFIKYISAENDRLLIVPGKLNTRKMNVEVLDMQGRLMHRSTKDYTTSSINTGGWSKGSYLLRITGNGKELFVQQFVKR